MNIKQVIFLIILLSIINPIFSNTCSQESDSYVVKCKIPDHYFIQSFTCLNDDCSIKIENKGKYQELVMPNKERTIILQKHIELKNIFPNLEALNKLCEKKFDDNTLKQLNTLIKNYHSKNWDSFSGENLVIEPLTNSKIDDSKIIEEKSSNDLTNCYTTKSKIYDNWIFTSKEKKEYCNIVYNNDETCFETTIDKTQFLGFIFSNPNKNTIPYIISIFLILTISGSLILFFDDLKKQKKLKKFLKLTKHKLLIKMILLIPTIYIVGIITNYLMNKKYFFYLSNGTEILIIFLTLPFLYLISAFIEYIFITKK